MIPGHIVSPTVLNQAAQPAVGGAGYALMDQVQIREAASRPSIHVGFDFVDGVPARRWPKSANLIPAGFSVYLRGAANVEGRAGLEGLGSVSDVADDASAYSELRFLL